MSREVIHLYTIHAHGLMEWYAHCACQWNSKPVRDYEVAKERGLRHIEAERVKRQQASAGGMR